MANELIIASAGSGKTTALVRKALVLASPVLITTFTEANELEIRAKFIKLHGFVPEHVTIQTWFSFLIRQGVKPYQSYLIEKRITGLLLVNQTSGVKYTTKSGFSIYYKEDEDIERHYLSESSWIYSDKLSKFVIRVNEKTKGKLIDRLSRIYPHIFIDESQDLAGYDLEIVKLLSKSSSNLVLVCDPRQTTYRTHHARKYPQYGNGLIEQFVSKECGKESFQIDKDSLSHSHRCNEQICTFSNMLYPTLAPSKSAQELVTEHDGIFIVSSANLDDYLKKYQPTQLRWSVANKKIHPEYEAWNFGACKGLTFERVVIYPTKAMLDWLYNRSSSLEDETRAKFYVAVTRACHSVAIVCDDAHKINIDGVLPYLPMEPSSVS